jgi:hypothetical protein
MDITVLAGTHSTVVIFGLEVLPHCFVLMWWEHVQSATCNKGSLVGYLSFKLHEPEHTA